MMKRIRQLRDRVTQKKAEPQQGAVTSQTAHAHQDSKPRHPPPKPKRTFGGSKTSRQNVGESLNNAKPEHNHSKPEQSHPKPDLVQNAPVNGNKDNPDTKYIDPVKSKTEEGSNKNTSQAQNTDCSSNQNEHGVDNSEAQAASKAASRAESSAAVERQTDSSKAAENQNGHGKLVATYSYKEALLNGIRLKAAHAQPVKPCSIQAPSEPSKPQKANINERERSLSAKQNQRQATNVTIKHVTNGNGKATSLPQRSRNGRMTSSNSSSASSRVTSPASSSSSSRVTSPANGRVTSPASFSANGAQKLIAPKDVQARQTSGEYDGKKNAPNEMNSKLSIRHDKGVASNSSGANAQQSAHSSIAQSVRPLSSADNTKSSIGSRSQPPDSLEKRRQVVENQIIVPVAAKTSLTAPVRDLKQGHISPQNVVSKSESQHADSTPSNDEASRNSVQSKTGAENRPILSLDAIKDMLAKINSEIADVQHRNTTLQKEEQETVSNAQAINVNADKVETAEDSVTEPEVIQAKTENTPLKNFAALEDGKCDKHLDKMIVQRETVVMRTNKPASAHTGAAVSTVTHVNKCADSHSRNRSLINADTSTTGVKQPQQLVDTCTATDLCADKQMLNDEVTAKIKPVAETVLKQDTPKTTNEQLNKQAIETVTKQQEKKISASCGQPDKISKSEHIVTSSNKQSENKETQILQNSVFESKETMPSENNITDKNKGKPGKPAANGRRNKKDPSKRKAEVYPAASDITHNAPVCDSATNNAPISNHASRDSESNSSKEDSDESEVRRMYHVIPDFKLSDAPNDYFYDFHEYYTESEDSQDSDENDEKKSDDENDETNDADENETITGSQNLHCEPVRIDNVPSSATTDKTSESHDVTPTEPEVSKYRQKTAQNENNVVKYDSYKVCKNKTSENNYTKIKETKSETVTQNKDNTENTVNKTEDKTKTMNLNAEKCQNEDQSVFKNTLKQSELSVAQKVQLHDEVIKTKKVELDQTSPSKTKDIAEQNKDDESPSLISQKTDNMLQTFQQKMALLREEMSKLRKTNVLNKVVDINGLCAQPSAEETSCRITQTITMDTPNSSHDDYSKMDSNAIGEQNPTPTSSESDCIVTEQRETARSDIIKEICDVKCDDSHVHHDVISDRDSDDELQDNDENDEKNKETKKETKSNEGHRDKDDKQQGTKETPDGDSDDAGNDGDDASDDDDDADEDKEPPKRLRLDKRSLDYFEHTLSLIYKLQDEMGVMQGQMNALQQNMNTANRVLIDMMENVLANFTS